MRIAFYHLIIVSAAFLLSSLRFTESMAQSGTPRCDRPPFGAPEAKYLAYAKNFEHMMPAGQIMPMICAAKFSGGPRYGLHNAGITDAQIESEDVGDLTLDIIKAIWQSFHPNEQLPPEASRPPMPSEDNRRRIYAIFTCNSGYCTAEGPLPSKEACEERLRMVGGDRPVDSEGRVEFGQGTTMECRSKAVDDWEH